MTSQHVFPSALHSCIHPTVGCDIIDLVKHHSELPLPVTLLCMFLCLYRAVIICDGDVMYVLPRQLGEADQAHVSYPIEYVMHTMYCILCVEAGVHGLRECLQCTIGSFVLTPVA